jgi:hypothetical protein
MWGEIQDLLGQCSSHQVLTGHWTSQSALSRTKAVLQVFELANCESQYVRSATISANSTQTSVKWCLVINQGPWWGLWRKKNVVWKSLISTNKPKWFIGHRQVLCLHSITREEAPLNIALYFELLVCFFFIDSEGVPRPKPSPACFGRKLFLSFPPPHAKHLPGHSHHRPLRPLHPLHRPHKAPSNEIKST